MWKGLRRLCRPVAAPDWTAAARTVAELSIAAGRNEPLGILPVYVHDYHDGGVVVEARSFHAAAGKPIDEARTQGTASRRGKGGGGGRGETAHVAEQER